MSTSPLPQSMAQRDPSDAVEAISNAIHAVRGALVDAISDVADPLHPRTLARALGINRGLAWRVSRVLAEQSAGEALQALPRPKSLAILLDACERRGAKAQAIARARSAIVELEVAMKRSGEERRSIPSLIVASGLNGEGSAHFATARQKLFEGARILWGVEAEIGLRLVLAWPGSKGQINGAIVRGTIGLAALRHVSWPISYFRAVTEHNAAMTLAERPIDGEPGSGLPFMPRFCSTQAMAVKVDESRGMLRHEVTPAALGRAGRLTCVLGTAAEDMFMETLSPGDSPASMMMIIETPLRSLQFDLLVHEDLQLARPSRVVFCDRLTRPHGYERARVDAERLPLEGTLVDMGSGSLAMATPRIPWYAELVEHAATRLGLNAQRFNGYRMELPYPPISTAALLQFWPARRGSLVRIGTPPP